MVNYRNNNGRKKKKKRGQINEHERDKSLGTWVVFS